MKKSEIYIGLESTLKMLGFTWDESKRSQMTEEEQLNAMEDMIKNYYTIMLFSRS